MDESLIDNMKFEWISIFFKRTLFSHTVCGTVGLNELNDVLYVV